MEVVVCVGRRGKEEEGGGGGCGGCGGWDLSMRAHDFATNLKMDQCQCTGPFGWTDQPDPP